MTNHSRSPAPDERKFDVFISYSRRDLGFARRLQRALDNYAPPGDLPVPQRRLRVFRDESDFRGNEYSSALQAMIESSSTLLVICSPNSYASAYVGGEIAAFDSARGREHIVTALLSGRPNNEAGCADGEKAFHAELVARLPLPLAADYRGWKDGERVDRDRFEGAWFKLLSDIYAGYGVERSAVEGREKARQRRSRRIRAAVVGSVMAVLAGLTLWALFSRNEAIRQGNTARSRFLAMQSMSGTVPFDVAMLLAVAAQRTAPTFEAWEALFTGLQRQPRVRTFLYGADGPVQDFVVSGGGTCAAGWIAGRHTDIWDLKDGLRAGSVTGRAIPDNTCRALVVASDTGDLELRSRADGQRVWSAPSPGGAVTAWAFAPGGASLAVAYASGRVIVRDPQTGQVRAEHADAGAVWRYLRFSGDGSALVAIGRGNAVHRWDAASLAAAPAPGRCGAEAANVFAISPDLRWCAAGSEGYFVISRLDASNAEPIDLGPQWILALDFSPDSRTLTAGVQGGALQFRSVDEIVRSGRDARHVTWSEHRTDVTAAAYSPDGHTLVSAARDRSVIVWSPAAPHRLVSEVRLSPIPAVLAARADTPALALATSTGEIHVSAQGSTQGFVRIANAGAEVTALALGPAGDVLAGTADGRALVVRRDAAPRALPFQYGGKISDIRLSADGARAVIVTADGAATLWDLNNENQLSAFPPTKSESLGAFGGPRATFEPGGPRIVLVTGGREAYIWQPGGSLTQPVPLPFQPTSFFNSVAVAAANGLIALGTGLYEEEIVLLDPVRSGQPIARLPSHNQGKIAVTALAFSPDGEALFSGLFDGAITVWDVAGRRRMGDIYPAPGAVTDLSFAADGSAVTAVTDQGAVLRWNMNIEMWRDVACAIANRDLSVEERARFLDESTIAVCP